MDNFFNPFHFNGNLNYLAFLHWSDYKVEPDKVFVLMTLPE
jgi:hypothetical protein